MQRKKKNKGEEKKGQKMHLRTGNNSLKSHIFGLLTRPLPRPSHMCTPGEKINHKGRGGGVNNKNTQ